MATTAREQACPNAVTELIESRIILNSYGLNTLLPQVIGAPNSVAQQFDMWPNPTTG
jgi:hypothetical protein